MAEHKTILVIDDSTTIRRLVDTTLSREGYTVILADNADDGLAFAVEHQPDMILLDHQLPGTTGLDVSKRLREVPDLAVIPVVVSSTLRKKAYIEYGDMDNVIDMLPKPYTEELLLTTVSNALDTGSLVVESQSQGTAVPEVINAQGESDLGGTFNSFSVREVLDFLNNGGKRGVLEVEAEHKRYSIYLEQGRVVGITATGVAPDEVIDRLPSSLEELAPVLNVTMGRGGTAALASIVDLLNSEVLDPRLLRRLLRHQAAILLLGCFDEKLTSFRFDGRRSFPQLFQRLPLGTSVLALLVEGASTRNESEVPDPLPHATFARLPIRGQNLDRTGLSAQDAMVLGQLSTGKTLIDIAQAVGRDPIDVRKVLYGLELAELIACTGTQAKATTNVLVYEANSEIANKINKAFTESEAYDVTVVNDATAAKLIARRTVPAVIVVDASNDDVFQELRENIVSEHTKWIAASDVEQASVDLTIPHPYDARTLLDSLDFVTRGESAEPTKLTQPEKEHSLEEERDLCTTTTA